MSEQTFELEKLYLKLGAFFPKQSEKYFQLALIHPSLDGKPGGNYEQLEFLGDAVLSIIVTEYLYQNYPLKKEGELSKMRSFIVSRPQLNAVADEVGLETFVQHKIEKKYLNLAKDIGGNVVEALIGAYYLDGGIEAAKQFVYKWIVNPEKLEALQLKSLDPKSKLHEWAQRRKKKLEFRLLQPNLQNPKEFKIEVWINDACYGSGIGSNKKNAEKNAAIAALHQLDPHAR